jgi:integrase/recombinase XerD
MKKTKELTVLNGLKKSGVRLDYEFFKNFESEHTRISYRNDIGQFFNFFRNYFSNENNFERVHIVAYRNFLQEKNLAPKTIGRKLSSLSSYFDFLVEKGFLGFNPATSIKRPRQEVLSPTNDLTDAQIGELLASADLKSPSGHLHNAILHTLFYTGIRKSELTNLKLSDLKKVNEHKILEIRAKGGKFLQKVLHPDCYKAISNYLSWMKSKDREILPKDWLFQPTKNPKDPILLNRRLTAKSIDYIVAIHCRKCGISGRISPHSARASYIGSSLDAGADLLTVSLDVGHSSVKTTEIYNKRRKALNQSPAYLLKFFKKGA